VPLAAIDAPGITFSARAMAGQTANPIDREAIQRIGRGLNILFIGRSPCLVTVELFVRILIAHESILPKEPQCFLKLQCVVITHYASSLFVAHHARTAGTDSFFCSAARDEFLN
jgi:hypothetical protein